MFIFQSGRIGAEEDIDDFKGKTEAEIQEIIEEREAKANAQILKMVNYSKTCLQQPLKKKTKIGFQDRLSLNAGQMYCRMLQGEHSAILSTFIKLPFAFKTFVLSIFEWLLKTCFTVITTYKYFLFCGVCRLTVR